MFANDASVRAEKFAEKIRRGNPASVRAEKFAEKIRVAWIRAREYQEHNAAGR